MLVSLNHGWKAALSTDLLEILRTCWMRDSALLIFYVVKVFNTFEIYKLTAVQLVKNKAITYTSLLCV